MHTRATTQSAAHAQSAYPCSQTRTSAHVPIRSSRTTTANHRSWPQIHSAEGIHNSRARLPVPERSPKSDSSTSSFWRERVTIDQSGVTGSRTPQLLRLALFLFLFLVPSLLFLPLFPTLITIHSRSHSLWRFPLLQPKNLPSDNVDAC